VGLLPFDYGGSPRPPQGHGETPSGELYLVMEWLEGEDLERRLARAPLTAGEAVTLATRVAEALGRRTRAGSSTGT